MSVSWLQGSLCHTLQGHGHWVNTMALNTDYVLRTGAFDPGDRALHHTGVDRMSGELCACVGNQSLSSRSLVFLLQRRSCSREHLRGTRMLK